eukprot:TRINITY_DN22792_c0_g1_i1.p1 TRINITY_DN22792_c0_g1~~TRINITY_DN22792_c0_g1_i1.p1  ORF type:complete len:761 (-),score=112.77 TRINITY_DN22792_c0_g1_i1:60-2297(-)
MAPTSATAAHDQRASKGERRPADCPEAANAEGAANCMALRPGFAAKVGQSVSVSDCRGTKISRGPGGKRRGPARALVRNSSMPTAQRHRPATAPPSAPQQSERRSAPRPATPSIWRRIEDAQKAAEFDDSAFPFKSFPKTITVNRRSGNWQPPKPRCCCPNPEVAVQQQRTLLRPSSAPASSTTSFINTSLRGQHTPTEPESGPQTREEWITYWSGFTLHQVVKKSDTVLEKLGGDWHRLGNADLLARDRNFVLAAVGVDGLSLQHVSRALRADDEIVICAVRQNGLALKYANKALRGDRIVVSLAVENIPAALKFASTEVRGEREVVMRAVRRAGTALRYASRELRDDKRVVLEAVRQDGRSLCDASDSLRADAEVVLAAIQHDGRFLSFASADLQNEFGMVVGITPITRMVERLKMKDRAEEDANAIQVANTRVSWALAYVRSDEEERALEATSESGDKDERVARSLAELRREADFPRTDAAFGREGFAEVLNVDDVPSEVGSVFTPLAGSVSEQSSESHESDVADANIIESAEISSSRPLAKSIRGVRATAPGAYPTTFRSAFLRSGQSRVQTEEESLEEVFKQLAAVPSESPPLRTASVRQVNAAAPHKDEDRLQTSSSPSDAWRPGSACGSSASCGAFNSCAIDPSERPRSAAGRRRLRLDASASVGGAGMSMRGIAGGALHGCEFADALASLRNTTAGGTSYRDSASPSGAQRPCGGRGWGYPYPQRLCLGTTSMSTRA